jgi:hypothetical protein
MATVAQLEARLEALKAQRDSAVARVSYDGRMIARRPDTIVGFGETRIHAETATFEVRASEIANPRPDDQLTSAARPSSCRASRSDAIPTGSCGRSMRGGREPGVG